MKAANDCINVSVLLKDSSDAGYARSLNDRMKYNYDLGDYQRSISDAVMCERVTRNYFATGFCNPEISILPIDGARQPWLVCAVATGIEEFLRKQKIFRRDHQTIRTGFLQPLQWLCICIPGTGRCKSTYAKALSLLQKGLTHARNIKHYYTCKQILNTIGADVYAAYYKDDAKAMTAYRQVQ